MARYTGPVDRLARREGMQLYLKGERCFKQKDGYSKRPFPPGQHGRRRIKLQGYGQQLREKQKVKRVYGVLERQFRIYFKKAAAMRGVTGDNLLRMLEQRLDNTVYRLGFGTSRAQARQLVNHGHVLVNGRKVDIVSFQVSPGDVIEVREKSRKNAMIRGNIETAHGRGIPAWVELDAENFKGTVVKAPSREDITLQIQENLIVELYSK